MEMKIVGTISRVYVETSEPNVTEVRVRLKPDDAEQDSYSMDVIVERHLVPDWMKQVGRKAEIVLTTQAEKTDEDTVVSKDGKLQPYSRRIGDVEVRTCNSTLLSSGKHVRMEIVNWYKPSHEDAPMECCYTIAMWDRSNDGFDLQFVGNRPFEIKVDKEAFWELAKESQQRLTQYFEEGADK